ncbi:hypothetical protein RHMOL_Rhmol03G0259200 [Rhododendron molle]|uniref:Uncharacterized protein n=1 Tax=Rhododendron molle TaxID=49168 RepID=A0ACC0PKV8_RHOML|nr:hypothetical protein RHMOL_Rhmol03G0259200 [Rhododendron molle]
MGFATVTLLFYHGSYISEGPEKKYVGGNVTPLDIDPDLMSYLDSEICRMYQKGPHQTMDDGLVGLTSYQTMLDIFAMHKDNNSKVIDIYIHNPMLVQNKTSGEELSTLTKTDPTVQGDDIGDLDDLVDFDDIVDLDKIPTDEGVVPAGPLEDNEDDSDRDWECGDKSGDKSGDDSGERSDGGSDDDNFSGFHSLSEDDEEVEQMLAIKIRKEEEEVSDQSDDQGLGLEVVCHQLVSQKKVEMGLLPKKEGLLAKEGEGEEELAKEGAEELGLGLGQLTRAMADELWQVDLWQ